MATIDFSSLQNVKVTLNSARLKPWSTYKVKFVGLEEESFKGKKDPNAVFKALKLSFEGDEGVFDKRVFYVNEEGASRKVYKNNEGHEYERPSNFENTMIMFIQLLMVFNETSAQAFHEYINKVLAVKAPFDSKFEKIIEKFKSLLNPEKGKTLYIKLNARNVDGSVYAELPSACGLKDGQLFSTKIFSSKDDFTWTSYEKQQRDAYLKATPTDMSKVKPASKSDDTIEDNEDLETINTESLLDDLDL